MKRLWMLVLILAPLAFWLAVRDSRPSPLVVPPPRSAPSNLAAQNLPLISTTDSATAVSSSSSDLPSTPGLHPSTPGKPSVQPGLVSAILKSSPSVPLEASSDLPLVAVAADRASTLRPDQVVMMRHMAEDFLADTEAASAPSKTAHAKSRRPPKSEWERAVELSDARFQAMFGQEAFNAFQVERAAQAANTK